MFVCTSVCAYHGCTTAAAAWGSVPSHTTYQHEKLSTRLEVSIPPLRSQRRGRKPALCWHRVRRHVQGGYGVGADVGKVERRPTRGQTDRQTHSQKITHHPRQVQVRTSDQRPSSAVSRFMLTYTTSGQRISMKGRIADSLSLPAANGFVQSWPYLVHGSFDSHESVSQTASWLVQLLLRTPQQRFPMLFSGPDNPKIVVSPLEGSGNTWFLGPTRVRSPNGISISSAVLQGSQT